MRSTCVQCNLSHVELNKLTKQRAGERLASYIRLGPAIRVADLDMGSVFPQGDPAQFHDGDGVTLKPNLAPPQPPPHPQLPWAQLCERVNSIPALPAGGQ